MAHNETFSNFQRETTVVTCLLRNVCIVSLSMWRETTASLCLNHCKLSLFPLQTIPYACK